MHDVLIVIDMQKDFIDGSLGTKEAISIVPGVKNKIEVYQNANKKIIFTRDTHDVDYLSSFEGQHLPVEHCIKGSLGWQIYESIWQSVRNDADITIIDKPTFGYTKWRDILDPLKTTSMEICGLCTDICVISNILILRALYPNMDMCVDATCCAGVTVTKHKAALEVMRSCQVEVI